MKKSKVIIITFISLLVLGLMALPTMAQSPVTVEVDRTSLSTDEVLTLTIAVDTANGQPETPALPAMSSFQVVGSSSGTQMQMINGNTTVKSTYQYSLRPTQTGTVYIDPFTVSINGQNYNSEPIEINVTQGTGQLQPANPMPSTSGMSGLSSLLQSFGFSNLQGSTGSGQAAPPLDPADAPSELVGQDFFIEAEVDNPTPYQGEQVTYTFRFYQAASLYDQPDFQPPSFSGFWNEQLPDQAEFSTEAAGRAYRVTELQTVLFPTLVGEATIDPATLTIPGELFSRGQKLQTNAVTLDVQPLPEGAPADFQGAVGQFAMQADVDTAVTEVNDTVTLNVTLSGFGNIEALPDPIWNEGPEWRAFDSNATTNTQMVDGRNGGTRSYERLLVPTTPGDLTISPVSYSYFDPQTESYQTITSDPFTIQVTGDAAAGVPLKPVVGSGATAVVPTANTLLQPIKPAAAIGNSSVPITQNGIYWLLWTLPLFFLLGTFGWQRYQQYRFATVDVRRSQKAAGQAKQALGQARRNSNGDSATAGPILVNYIATKLNRPVSGLTQNNLSMVLTAQGIDSALTERVQSCLTRSEMGRYAPEGLNTTDDDLFRETEQVINELDKVI